MITCGQGKYYFVKLLNIYTELGCKMSILLWIVVKKKNLEARSIREGRNLLYARYHVAFIHLCCFPSIPNGPTITLVSLF